MMDNVPFIVEQAGVQHSSSVVRNMIWASTGGQRGVIGPGSLAVVAQNVPTGSVQVRAGVAVLPSNYPGSAMESYVARNRSATNVTINPTGSSGGRTDAIILKIQDTGKAGQTPADIQNFDYAKLDVIQGVSAGLNDTDALNLTYPAILLATVTLPANTGTVTNAMIKDHRHIALAREESVIYPRPIISKDPSTALGLTGMQDYPDGEHWPNVGGQNNDGVFWIDIPKWATKMQLTADFLSVVIPPKSGWGGFWVTWGPGAMTETPQYASQYAAWDASENSSTYRANFTSKQELSIPAALRGTRQPFVMRGNRSASSNNSTYPGRIKLDANSGVCLSVRFLERPDTDLAAD